MLLVADGDTSSADGRYNGTTSGRAVKFVPDNYLGGVTMALDCNSVGRAHKNALTSATTGSACLWRQSVLSGACILPAPSVLGPHVTW